MVFGIPHVAVLELPPLNLLQIETPYHGHGELREYRGTQYNFEDDKVSEDSKWWMNFD